MLDDIFKINVPVNAFFKNSMIPNGIIDLSYMLFFSRHNYLVSGVVMHF